MQLPSRLVQTIDDLFVVTVFGPETDLIAAMAARGFAFAGVHENPRTRAELQGAPKFKGVLGPMWDGDAIRYEDQATYDAMSA